MTERALSAFVKASGITEIFVDEKTGTRAMGLFLEAELLSLTDSTTMVLAESMRIRSLATYDERSFGGRSLDVVGRGYFEALDDK